MRWSRFDVMVMRDELRCVLYAEPTSSPEVRMDARRMMEEVKEWAREDLSAGDYRDLFGGRPHLEIVR